MKRIAIVHPNIDPSDLSITSEHLGYRTLFEELRRRGYGEGSNLVVERYSAGGQTDRYADLARDVIGTNPDLILAIANPLVLSFKEATTKIPLVAVAGNMVASGIVPSLARPGGNITGISTDVGGKRYLGEAAWSASGSNAKIVERPVPYLAIVLGKGSRRSGSKGSHAVGNFAGRRVAGGHHRRVANSTCVRRDGAGSRRCADGDR